MNHAHDVPRPARPATVTAAVTCWAVLGGLMAVLGFLQPPMYFFTIMWWALSASVLVGAVKLRAGFRGPRYGFSIVAVAMLVTTTAVSAMPGAGGVRTTLLILITAGSAIATVLVWLPATSRYIRYVRLGR
ncbi:hypothetical protein [Allokutzneria multivorans]|uniref:hypothetical protein n=1 Tax=Allokutzneria multivorans TaxID=1142134 RepID=UPI0031E59DE5